MSDVAVVRIVEPVAVVAVFGSLNLGTRKRPLQLVEEVLSAAGAIADSTLGV